MGIELHCMSATDYRGDADFVFTNPYAPLPRQLLGKPSIINLYEGKGSRKAICEDKWMPGTELIKISTWGAGQHNTIYIANLGMQAIDLTGYEESHWCSEAGKGWFPLAMCGELLRLYARAGMTVFDGFMGRGTVGKACLSLGMNFVGVDIDPERVALARRYLEEEG